MLFKIVNKVFEIAFIKSILGTISISLIDDFFLSVIDFVSSSSFESSSDAASLSKEVIYKYNIIFKK